MCPLGGQGHLYLLGRRRWSRGGSASFHLPRGEGARRADEGLLLSRPEERVPAGRIIVCDLPPGEGARRADEGLSTFPWGKVPAGRISVFLPSPWEKVPAGRISVFLPSPWGRCQRGESSFVTFPREKVPAGRMRVTQYPHQSRCARQLCLRHASSPKRSFFLQYVTESLRSRRGEASLISAPMKANHFRSDASPVHLITKAYYAPAGRMRGFLPSPGGRCPQGG